MVDNLSFQKKKSAKKSKKSMDLKMKDSHPSPKKQAEDGESLKKIIRFAECNIDLVQEEYKDGPTDLYE